MELRITVFSRRMGRRVTWWTLGLGADNATVSGADEGVVRQKLTDRLRKTFAERWPADLERSEYLRGRRLELVNVDLQWQRAQGTVRLRGRVPVILEPRPRGPGLPGALTLVYHPMRSHESFVHEPGRSLAEEAQRYFRERWSELGDECETLLQPEKGVRDRLQVLAFRIRPKRLIQMLDEEQKQPRAMLGGGTREKGEALLRRVGTNVTTLAIDRRLGTGMPRPAYRGQLQQLLAGKHKKPTILVGPSGVGKSTLLRQWVADLLVAEDFPSHRSLDRIHSVWEILGRRIIAGMSYLGQWEQRCVDIVAACREHRALLWVGDISAWGRIGASRDSERCLATLFRGPVARGELLIVGECTPEGYHQLQDDAPGFAAAFTPVFVEPTERDLTFKLLVHEARRLELELGVAFDPRAFRTLFDLGSAIGAGRSMPGRVLDLLGSLAKGDAAVREDLAQVETLAQDGKKLLAIKAYRELTSAGLADAKLAVERFMERGTWPARVMSQGIPEVAPRSLLDPSFKPGDLGRVIGPQQVIRMLVRRTGMPETLLSTAHALAAQEVRQAFEGQIMGQPEAAAAMTDLVLRIKSGMTDAGRPYGVFLFTGPTGTGKTEMAKCLAEYLFGSATRLVRFDMSEYNDRSAPARLIGDRFAPDGVLTSKVRHQPFCVLLLDEIEKADPSVLNLLLQLFDDGRLTDATGVAVDFRHAVIIMTSNLGAKTHASLGFGAEPQAAARASVAAAVKEFFPPELFNRIDRVVSFAPLSLEAAHRIAARELRSLLDRRGLTERNVFVRYTPAVLELAVRVGFNARDGARSLKRYLEDHVGAYLADEIAARSAAAVRTFWLYHREGHLRLVGHHLDEAMIEGQGSTFEALVRASLSELRAGVPQALARARALLSSPALLELDLAVQGGLAAFGAVGEAAIGEHVYRLESLRGELRRVAETLQIQLEYDPLLLSALSTEERLRIEGELLEAEDFGHIERTYAGGYSGADGTEKRLKITDRRAIAPALPLKNRRDFLAAYGDLAFVERALQCVEDPAEHTVLVELTRLSRSAGTSRFAAVGPGLLEWLAAAYANSRGEVEEVVAVESLASGVVEILNRKVAVRRAVEQIAIRIVGTGVRTMLAREEGCHVRESLTGGTEVVRVRIYDGRDTTARDHVAGLQTRRDAYVFAIEHGASDGPATQDPEAVLPIVRRYHYDPETPNQQSWIEVEDFPLAYAERRQVRQLAEVLPDLWFLHLGTRPAEAFA